MKTRIKLKIRPTVAATLRRLGEANPETSWTELTEHLIAVGLELPTALAPGYLPTALYIVPTAEVRAAVSADPDPRAALEAALEKGAALARICWLAEDGNVTS